MCLDEEIEIIVGKNQTIGKLKLGNSEHRSPAHKASSKNECTRKKNEINLQFYQEFFLQHPIMLSNAFSRSDMQNIADISLVIYGSLRFEDTF